MLKYNLDFEIMGFLITVIMAFYFHINYVTNTKSDKAFKKLLLYIIGAEVFDMLTAVTFSFENPKWNYFNLLMNTVYFLFAAATSVGFEGYITSYIEVVSENKIYCAIRRVVFCTYVLHGLINPFTKLAFYFDEAGHYNHGPLYILGYIIPGLFVASALYQIIRYRKCFDKKQWISSAFFIGVVFIAMVLQAFVFTDIYLTYGLVPVALLTIMFSLETPDYRKLIDTMDELEKAKAEALHANQVKTDFLANMSHEIRTPINAVLGFNEMILRESQETKTIEYAKNVKDSGQLLLSIVNDILDISKIEAGKMEIIPQEYGVVEMVNELTRMIAPRAEAKGLKLNVDIDSKIPRRLKGDDVRISQVLSNLLTNAVKYTNQGEVTLQIKAEKPVSDKVHLFFSVRDTGVGIKEENTEVLFSEFSRIEDSNIRKIEGTGLGLPISMKCLNMMGSKLEVKSVYGEGSVFFFFLTQDVVDSVPIGEYDKTSQEHNKKVSVFKEYFTAEEARILVVDDVEMNLKVFKGLLNKSLIQIDSETSGEAAIERIKNNNYDIIFMDHQMPQMDGIETMERLHRDPDIDMSSTPVIALTANAISGAKEMYLENGFSDYLSKPVNGWELSEMLQKWLPKDKIVLKQEGAESEKTSENRTESREVITEDGTEETDIIDNLKENNEEKIEKKIEEKTEEKIEEKIEEKTADSFESDILSKLSQVGLNVKEALSYALEDEGFYLELVNDFINDYESRSSDLERYYNKREWKNYEINVHSLKSSSKTIGLNQLAEEALVLELAAKKQETALIDEKHGLLLEHYKGFIELLKEILNKNI